MLEGMQLAIYIILICGIICGIAGFMEIYKKTIRKKKPAKWENYVISFVLSVISVVLLILAKVFQPILGQIGAPIWVDYIAYVIVIYFAQMQADMKIIKKIVKSLTNNLLKKAGFTDAQIKEILDVSKNS